MNADDLFKRLEQSKAEDSGDLDDFEKEALEGFAMLDNPAEARTAYDDVLAAISKKTAEKPESSGNSRGIIWFSAAAGLIIVIGLIALWFNSEKKSDLHNVAMNTASTDDKIQTPTIPSEEMENKPATPLKETVNTVNTATDTRLANGPTVPAQDQILANEKQVVLDDEQQVGLFKSTTDKTDRFRYETNKDAKLNANETQAPTEAKAEEQKLAEETNHTDGAANGTYKWTSSNSKTQPAVAATGSTISQETTDELSKKKSGKDKARKYNKEDEASAVAANKNVTRSAQQANNNVVGGAYDMPDVNNANQKSLETTPATATNREATTVSGDADLEEGGSKKGETKSPGTVTEAYYPGGDKAVKEYLLQKIAGLNKNLVLKGTYQVMATVKADGSLSVDKIINTSGDCTSCVPELQKALNGMKGWKPVSTDGKLRSSSHQMTLTF